MALGTLTTTVPYNGNPPMFMHRFTLVGDGAYVAGGTTGLKAKLEAELKRTVTIVAASGMNMANAKRCEYDVANEKLMCFVAAGTEEANGSLAAQTYTITCWYK